jgi:hypothetical protein
MESTHVHSPAFRKKRTLFLLLVTIAVVAAIVMAYTGSVLAGFVSVLALAGALVSGVGVACHNGCSPTASPRVPRG